MDLTQDEKPDAAFPALRGIRWQLAEFLYLEYLDSDAVLLDIGLFAQAPTDEELEQALQYLEKAALPYLNLKDVDWTLDLGALSGAFPELKPLGLTGVLTHPAAFETATCPPRRFKTHELTIDGFYVLRISFEFNSGPILPEDGELSAAEIPPDTEIPKFIS